MEIGSRNVRGGGARKIKKPSFLGLVSVFGGGYPHATAVAGLPSLSLAGFTKVLCGGLCGLLGLSILDFVEFHSF